MPVSKFSGIVQGIHLLVFRGNYTGPLQRSNPEGVDVMNYFLLAKVIIPTSV